MTQQNFAQEAKRIRNELPTRRIMLYDEWEIWFDEKEKRYYVIDHTEEECHEIRLVAELIINENDVIAPNGAPYVMISTKQAHYDELFPNTYFGQSDEYDLDRDTEGTLFDRYMWFEIINE